MLPAWGVEIWTACRPPLPPGATACPLVRIFMAVIRELAGQRRWQRAGHLLLTHGQVLDGRGRPNVICGCCSGPRQLSSLKQERRRKRSFLRNDQRRQGAMPTETPPEGPAAVGAPPHGEACAHPPPPGQRSLGKPADKRAAGGSRSERTAAITDDHGAPAATGRLAYGASVACGEPGAAAMPSLVTSTAGSASWWPNSPCS